MISNGVLGFTILLFTAGTVGMSCAAALTVTHNQNEFGRWAGLGLGIIAMTFAVPLVIIASRIAGSIN